MEVAAVRASLLDEHEPLLRAVVDCADRVSAEWEGEATLDGEAVAAPFEQCLRAVGVVERLPAVLASAVAAGGEQLQAQPVPAPPYVVVTSVGVVLRATLSDGRLVITIAPFRLETDPRRYVRVGESPADVLSVEFR